MLWFQDNRNFMAFLYAGWNMGNQVMGQKQALLIISRYTIAKHPPFSLKALDRSQELSKIPVNLNSIKSHIYSSLVYPLHYKKVWEYLM